jgi:hypothetical protein
MFLMALMVAFLAYVIDMAHVLGVKNEIQNAGDDCALRGARAFLPDNITITGPTELDPDPGNAKAQAQIAIQDNRSDNTAFQLGDLDQGDIQVGIWDYVNRKLLDWHWPPPSSMWGQYIGPGIKLPTNRNTKVSLGPVRTTLASLFGIKTVPVRAWSTAALSGVGGFRQDAGKPDFPICLNKDYIDSQGQGAIIDLVFGQAKSDNAGWTNLQPQPGSHNTRSSDLQNWFAGTLGPGDLYGPDHNIVSLQNGVDCDAIKALIDNQGIGLNPHLALVKAEGYPSYNGYPPVNDYSSKNKVYVPDPNIYGYPWQPNNGIPIYTFAVCQDDKFNQWHAISAVSARVLAVWDSPGCTMRIQVTGTVTALPGTRAGGPWYGVLSTEPKLVE